MLLNTLTPFSISKIMCSLNRGRHSIILMYSLWWTLSLLWISVKVTFTKLFVHWIEERRCGGKGKWSKDEASDRNYFTRQCSNGPSVQTLQVFKRFRVHRAMLKLGQVFEHYNAFAAVQITKDKSSYSLGPDGTAWLKSANFATQVATLRATGLDMPTCAFSRSLCS